MELFAVQSRCHRGRSQITHILQKSTFGKRQAAVVGHDHVIQNADVDQLQGFAQPARDQLVGLAGLGDSGRMVVRLMCP